MRRIKRRIGRGKRAQNEKENKEKKMMEEKDKDRKEG